MRWFTRTASYSGLNHSQVLIVMFLGLSWLGIQVFLFVTHGIKTSVDTPLYVSSAKEMLLGNLPSGHDVWYFSYCFFLAVVFFMGGGMATAVALQIFISGIAVILVARAAWRLSGNMTASLISSALYVFWFPLQEWNYFVYTDSLFVSFCVITYYLLIRNRWTLLTILIAVFTVFLRPTGFGLLAALAVRCAPYLKKKLNKFYPVAAIISGILILLVLDRMLQDFDFLPSYAASEIIYPGITLGVTAPANLYWPTDHGSSLIRHVMFIGGNFWYMTKITAFKLLLFFGNVKPYFSIAHNALIVVVLYPSYFLAWSAFRKADIPSVDKIFIASFIAIQGLIVACTSENWDGRFLLPVLPFIFLLAGIGVASAFQKKIISLPRFF